MRNQLEIMHKIIENSIDFHCHGVGPFDFTDVPNLDLLAIEEILAKRQQRTILTLYLHQQNFEEFLNLLTRYQLGKQQGRFSYITGFALEGPMLGSPGGTPKEATWLPTKDEWETLAACGSNGLIYMILSPDAQLIGSSLPIQKNYPSITWIAETLLTGGVLPAPGHFTRVNPKASAELLQSIFDVVSAWGQGPTITDHLYNDMPHNFKHAWRTKEEKVKRDQEIEALDLKHWDLSSLEERLGPVPATMIKNARKGLVKICQNFDDEHVDLAIVKRTVDLLGAENMLMMTDSIESKRLAGKALHMHEGSTLLYQDDDVVAAGSQGVSCQVEKMFSMGLSEDQVSLITHTVPLYVLGQREKYVSQKFSADTINEDIELKTTTEIESAQAEVFA